MSVRKLERNRTTFEPDLDTVSLPNASAAPMDALHQDVAKFKIADQLAMGGLSDIDRQFKLATDVYMSDEERVEYQRRNTAQAAGPAAAPAMSRTSTELSEENTLQNSPFAAKTAGPGPTLAQFDLRQAETPLPPRGPFGDFASLGAEGSFVPQGFMAPQGLMNSYGFMGPQGLMAPTGLRSASAAPSAHPAPGPEAAQSGPFHNAPTMSEEIQRNFQPTQLQSSIPSPWQKKGPSPIEEIFNRLINLLRSIMGFGKPGGYRGGKPELGRD
jgi:hypothetical protein